MLYSCFLYSLLNNHNDCVRKVLCIWYLFLSFSFSSSFARTPPPQTTERRPRHREGRKNVTCPSRKSSEGRPAISLFWYYQHLIIRFWTSLVSIPTTLLLSFPLRVVQLMKRVKGIYELGIFLSSWIVFSGIRGWICFLSCSLKRSREMYDELMDFLEECTFITLVPCFKRLVSSLPKTRAFYVETSLVPILSCY